VRVRVRGKSPKLSRMEARYAFHWALEQMLPSHLLKELSVTIIFRQKIEHTRTTEDYYKLETYKGVVLEDYVTRGYSRNYTIRIANKYRYKHRGMRLTALPRSQQLGTLYHEARHIVQSVLGMCKNTANPEIVMWKGAAYKSADDSEEDYNNAPWEKDAKKWEKKLMRKYRDHIKKIKLSF
jgi:hypothetical protein